VSSPQRNTTRQREAGAASRAETRRRLVAAAAELFGEQGYTATTVNSIARQAGVSLQTLYLAWGSKRDLLRAVLGQALSGTAGGIDADYLPRLHAQMVAATKQSHTEPERTVRALAHVFRAIAERATPWWRIYRDAAATDHAIAHDWATLTAQRRQTTAALLQGLTDEDLPLGLGRDQMTDTAWTLASPETCELLVRHGGYTLDAYERWVGDTLLAALAPR
jgi:AcrR family transcriptional regulator